MTSTDPPKLTVRSTADLISAVPYLLGFHPAESLVLLAMRDSRIVFVARGDLPEPGDPAELRQAAEYLAAVVARQGAEAVTIIGYGPTSRVTPVVDEMRVVSQRTGLLIFDVLRVTDGRYWSYLCEHPQCCPPEGTPFDPASSAVAAAATFAGHVALPDRASLISQIEPVSGPARESIGRATQRAEQRLAALLAAAPSADLVGARAVRSAGVAAVRLAEDRYRGRRQLSDDELAWLSVLLTHLPVRDHAWERIGAEDWQVTFWTDVVRRAEPGLVAAPASLLAFAAWRIGNGALATAAVERALTADPRYSMAELMADVLNGGLAPSTLDDWPEPDRARRLRRKGAGQRPSGPRPAPERAARPRRPRTTRRDWRPSHRDAR